jgi:HSP90 family molecular chaperone
VDKVLLSTHLTRSPVTLLASQYGATGNMERIMRAQAYQQGMDTQVQAWETMRKVCGSISRSSALVLLLLTSKCARTCVRKWRSTPATRSLSSCWSA